MTQDKIIKETINAHDQMLKRLWCIAYEEGKKTEREACAKVCDDIDTEYEGEDVLATWCAAAIRARSDK